MVKSFRAVRHSGERERAYVNMGIESRIDNWTFYLSQALRRHSSIDVGTRGSHNHVMLRLTAFYLKLPREGTEVAGI